MVNANAGTICIKDSADEACADQARGAGGSYRRGRAGGQVELVERRRDGVIATLLINVVKGGAIPGHGVGPALGEIDTRSGIARRPHEPGIETSVPSAMPSGLKTTL